MYVSLTTTDRLLDLQESVLVGMSFKIISLIFVSRDFLVGAGTEANRTNPFVLSP